MPMHRQTTTVASIVFTGLVLSACGGGGSGGDSTTPVVTYTLGGTVSGLSSEGLILSNGNSTAAVGAGTTTFSLGTASGSYAVQVATQPDGQICSVSNGSGTSTTNVQTVQVSCRGYVAYVANTNSDNIGQFSVTTGTGLLDPMATATVAVAHQPSTLAVSSDGAHAYVAFQDNRQMNAYAVGSSGRLSLLGSVNGTTAGYSLALHPSLSVLYAADYGAASVSQYTLGSDGLPVAMSPRSLAAGYNPRAVAVTPDGQYVYVINEAGDSISQYKAGSNGALTALSPATVTLTVSDTPSAIVIDASSSHAYVVLSGSNKVAQYLITGTGALTPMSPATVSAGANPTGIAISPNGVYAYVSNQDDGTVSQYQISAGRLTAMPTATVASGSAPWGVAISPDGRYAYVANSGEGTVSQFAIGAGGGLQALSTARVGSGGSKPMAIVVR
jgi:6-phosphogluconolactonase (cycloisomerase 2 family)